MEEYLFYQLKKYYEAGEDGLAWSHMRDIIMKSPEYLSLFLVRKREPILNELSQHGYIVSIRNVTGEVFKITPNGITAYNIEKAKKEEILKKENLQTALTQSIIDTNESVSKTNKNQKRLGLGTLVIASLSFFAIAVSAYFSSKSISVKEWRETNRILQNNIKILDSMQQFQKGIDSSFRKAVKDSFYKRR